MSFKKLTKPLARKILALYYRKPVLQLRPEHTHNMKRTVDNEFKVHLHKKLKSTFNKTIDNPVIKAKASWDILSEQLLHILGPAVHNQWFAPIKPLVLKNNILILQTETNFASQWINTHYQQLVEALLLTQDKKLSCFFIAPKKS